MATVDDSVGVLRFVLTSRTVIRSADDVNQHVKALSTRYVAGSTKDYYVASPDGRPPTGPADQGTPRVPTPHTRSDRRRARRDATRLPGVGGRRRDQVGERQDDRRLLQGRGRLRAERPEARNP